MNVMLQNTEWQAWEEASLPSPLDIPYAQINVNNSKYLITRNIHA
jgi:hypothetical protein